MDLCWSLKQKLIIIWYHESSKDIFAATMIIFICFIQFGGKLTQNERRKHDRFAGTHTSPYLANNKTIYLYQGLIFIDLSVMLPIHIVIILYHIQESQKRLMMNLFSITLLALMSILISCWCSFVSTIKSTT